MPRFWEHLAPRPFSIKTGWSQKASKLVTGTASQISRIPQNCNKCFLSKRNSLKNQLQGLSQLKIKTIVQHSWILYFVWAWHICFGWKPTFLPKHSSQGNAVITYYEQWRQFSDHIRKILPYMLNLRWNDKSRWSERLEGVGRIVCYLLSYQTGISRWGGFPSIAASGFHPSSAFLAPLLLLCPISSSTT